MKPLYTFKSSIKEMMIIFSLIPIFLFIITILSSFLNEGINNVHIIIMLRYALIVEIILFALAIYIGKQKIELYEDKIIIKRKYIKTEINYQDVLDIREESKIKKGATFEAPFLVLRLVNEKEIHIALNVFKKNKDELIEFLYSKLKNN